MLIAISKKLEDLLENSNLNFEIVPQQNYQEKSTSTSKQMDV